MDITLEKKDEVNGKLVVKVSKADYADKVEKNLKKIKQQAKMPGFRPGNVPMQLIQKMYGLEVKAEELEKTVSEAMNNYIKEQNLNLLTSPLLAEGAPKVDVEKADDFEMQFELGFAPTIDIELSDKDKIVYYNIQVEDKQVDDQIKSYRSRGGKFEEVDGYEDGDMLRGALVELDENGAEKEGGIKVEEASLMPKYFSNEEQKALFKVAKPGEDVIFNVSKAFDGKDTEIAAILKVKKEEVANYTSDFKYQVRTISRMKLAELNQEFFDSIYGKDAVKDEDGFRARVKADIEKIYGEDSDYKFILDVKDYCLKKVGEVKFPEEIMKREMLLNAKDDAQKKTVENDFTEIVKEREWSLICSKLIELLKVEINDEKVKEAAKVIARAQFAQYGLNNVPEEYVDNYANDMMKDNKQANQLVGRAIDIELTKAIKQTVKLQKKKISIEDFNKLFA
ncbi:MAG: trigger factor [Bacteroidaceae bacterium]|nr:trigger factor [Bacteroidaceae bacterium]